jgi:hypothetical protein
MAVATSQSIPLPAAGADALAAVKQLVLDAVSRAVGSCS